MATGTLDPFLAHVLSIRKVVAGERRTRLLPRARQFLSVFVMSLLALRFTRANALADRTS
jgi:hypothetical protein